MNSLHSPSHAPWYRGTDTWQLLMLRFVPLLAVFSLIWEVAQLPLYTIWTTASNGEIAYAVLHCTLGDVIVGSGALLIALIVTRAGPVATWRIRAITGITATNFAAFTIFSEWLNVNVLKSWAYAEAMPTLPGLGTGLSPLMQSLIVPSAAIALTWHCAYDRRGRDRASASSSVRNMASRGGRVR